MNHRNSETIAILVNIYIINFCNFDNCLQHCKQIKLSKITLIKTLI